MTWHMELPIALIAVWTALVLLRWDAARTWPRGHQKSGGLLPIARSILEEMKAADSHYGILSSGPISAEELLPVLAPLFHWGGVHALKWDFYCNSRVGHSHLKNRTASAPKITV